jgi:hypothetical protein
VNWSEEIRLKRLVQILGSLMTCSLLLTLSLWTSSTRLFPKSPVFYWLPNLPFSIEATLVVIIIGCSIAMVIRPTNFQLILPLLVLPVIQCVFDQLRIQPWLYLYMLLLLPVWLAKYYEGNERRWLMSILRFIVMTLYMWSGIHKVNPEYWNYTHGFIMAPIINLCPDSWLYLWEASGYMAPFIESILGFLLFFKLTRNWACIGIVFMHIVLLACLGPLGSNWNMSIWPWNIGMILIVCVLFYKSDWKIEWRDLFTENRKYVALFFGFLLCIAPGFNFVGLWDSYLSFSLYSGKTKSLHIYVHESAVNKLDPALQKLLVTNINAPTFRVLMADTWSFAELGVPVYPQRRIYMNTAHQVCDGTFLQRELFFLITNKSGKGEIEQLRCNQLD